MGVHMDGVGLRLVLKTTVDITSFISPVSDTAASRHTRVKI
jgi:hypothetical protein